MLGVLYALFLIESVLYTFLLTETLATFVGISVLGGIIWPRANRWGALASVLTALTTNFALYAITGQRLDHWDPNVFLSALVAGSVALVAVSLITAPEPRAAVDDFFERLQTSSDPVASADQPSASGAAPRKPLLLVNLLQLRRMAGGRGWRTYAEDLNGFALGWLVVFGLVAATAWLLR
jgi:Na+/proline symporter